MKDRFNIDVRDLDEDEVMGSFSNFGRATKKALSMGKKKKSGKRIKRKKGSPFGLTYHRYH
jgi:hypothetical protein